MPASHGSSESLAICVGEGLILELEGRSLEFDAAMSEMAAAEVGAVRDAFLEAVGASDWNLVRKSSTELKDKDTYSRNVVGSITVSPDEWDEEQPYSRIYLDLLEDGSICLQFTLYDPLLKDKEAVGLLVGGLVARDGHELLAINYTQYQAYAGDRPYWEATIRLLAMDATVSDLEGLRDRCTRLVKTFVPTQRSPAGRVEIHWEAARDIVLAGLPEYLLGQSESAWLEVKSRGYEFNAAGEIELAQDVARFANGDGPGLLLLGYRTKNLPGREVIEKVVPLDIKPSAPTLYHKTIDRLVYPPIRGLRAEYVAVGNGGVIAISVPAQREEDKPFLVTGAMVGDKCEGAFISIVRRRGEHSIPISAAAIHAALSAGRAALRQSKREAGPSSDGVSSEGVPGLT